MTRVRDVIWKQGVKSGIELMSLTQLRQKALDHSLSEPQKLDFHLLLFSAGTGSHMVDFKIHPFRRGTLIHVSPNQVHAFREWDRTEATILIFRPELLPVDFFGSYSHSYPTAEYLWPPTVQFDEASIEFTTATLKFLKNQQSSQDDWAQPEAVRHIVISLASYAYRSAVSSNSLYPSQPNPLFLEFLSLVEQSYSIRRDTKWYALRLDCSYRTLSRICRGVSGETPKVIIDRRVATEARRLLAFTRDSASEIGQKLGFTDPTNFGKFFQRVAKETPDAFRRNWNRAQ